MKWSYLLIALGITASLLTACSEKETTEEIAQRNKSLDLPTLHVLVDDKEIETKLISHSFTEKGEIVEEDDGAVVLAEDMEAIETEVSSLVQVYVEPNDQLEKLFIRIWEKDTAKVVKTKDNRFTLPEEPGTYTYEIMSFFQTGDMHHVLKITVH